MYGPDPDLVLYGRLMRGDQSALHQLLTKYEKEIHVVMWRIVQPHGTFEDVADLCRALALELNARLDEYNPDMGLHFSEWVHASAIRVADDFVQAVRRT